MSESEIGSKKESYERIERERESSMMIDRGRNESRQQNECVFKTMTVFEENRPSIERVFFESKKKKRQEEAKT